jgi:putative membrane-bound dehydrogenase-like protein
MKRTLFLVWLAGTLGVSSGIGAVGRNGKSYDFPIYTNQPPGRQLSGGHAPALSQPLTPPETQRRLQVPPGFEVRLFAAEPEVVNPVAMTWDERGRLWVLELYEYPKGAPRGVKGRDRIKILEDTDADGVADKVTVFADGFSLATGLELGNGGVYLGQAPDFLFLEDTNGDDRADRRTVLKTGFGMEDRHELLNGFAWGPDGWLYLTHGVFTHSDVRDPNHPDVPPVKMDAALARYQPRTKTFEVFADGTSNPWGVDWNERGDAFVSACVIHHLFHMAPGGQYNRQGGTWLSPYGYVGDLPSRGLPAIVDWRHYRAAHAGVTVYQGNQYPAEWQGLVFFGNIHQNAINCDRLTPVGATYTAQKESTLLGPSQGDWKVGAGNFLSSRDPWFRPVAVKTGPDGALWVMDWYDRYPCYQNAQADPNGVDREYGRIWRVVWVGSQPGKAVPSRPDAKMNLKQASSGDLVKLLADPNNWQRRQAQRLLLERQDPETAGLLREMIQKAPSEPALLAALWTFTSLPQVDSPGDLLPSYRARTGVPIKGPALEKEAPIFLVPAARAWMARALGERKDPQSAAILGRLASDPETSVRAAVAVALRQFASGSLTVDTPPAQTLAGPDFTRILKELLARPSVTGDAYYPHIVWMAMEPRLAENPEPFFSLFAQTDSSPVSAYCVYRAMRRICDLADASRREKYLNAAMRFLKAMTAKTQLAGAALDGLIVAQGSKGAPPTLDLEPIFAKLMENPVLADRARRLATLFGDTSASQSLLAKINDPEAGLDVRLQAIQAARESKTETARTELLKLLSTEKDQQRLLVEGVRALRVLGGDDLAYKVVEAWDHFTPATRRAAAEVLVTSTKWARALLAGVDAKQVRPEDISATARRALAQSFDATIRDHATRVLGRYRASGQDKLKLIAEKRKMILAGQPDIAAGHEVAKRTCFVCHKLYGEGAEVGPDLTGVGRSSLEALLHNVIDPNEVVGNGYETTEVELKDETVLSGRVIEETGTRLKLIASGPVEHTIAKSDIALANGKPKIRKLDLSLMPEGLEQMPDADFRNLIWYLLNPPQDNRPWTPALRRDLIGEQQPSKQAGQDGNRNAAFRGRGAQPGDGESVALWNPDWKVICPPFEGAPKKLSEYAGRNNVLMTHPISREKPAALEANFKVPAGQRTLLEFYVAADDLGDWELRVLADGKRIHRERVNKTAPRWKKVSLDLTPFAGRTVALRLENATNNWSWEFGYWADLTLRTEGPARRAGP